jgi:hypothetical protein
MKAPKSAYAPAKSRFLRRKRIMKTARGAPQRGAPAGIPLPEARRRRV